MPNSLGTSWHKANLNEYLAQCFLSALGVSAPVLRQEDIGIDFYCALSEEADGRLTFHSPFTVQCGSEDGKDFIYGGYAKENGRWRREARDWLFDQQLPFFVCTVSAKEARFRLYSTSARWLGRHACGHHRMAGLQLLPGERFDPVGTSIPKEQIAPSTDVCDGCIYGVPLREPVVQLSSESLTDKAALQQARDAMKQAVEIERHNITYNRDLEIYLTTWLTQITPNDASKIKTADSICYNETPGAHIQPLLDSLRKTALVLAFNLRAQKNQQSIEMLAPVFGLFDPMTFPRDFYDQLPQAVVDNWLKQKPEVPDPTLDSLRRPAAADGPPP
jgi:hypothetical protein